TVARRTSGGSNCDPHWRDGPASNGSFRTSRAWWHRSKPGRPTGTTQSVSGWPTSCVERARAVRRSWRWGRVYRTVALPVAKRTADPPSPEVLGHHAFDGPPGVLVDERVHAWFSTTITSVAAE